MNDKMIEFFKEVGLYDKEMFNYFNKNVTYIDYYVDDAQVFVGCWPSTKHGILKNITICVPYVVDDVTMAINIREFVYAIQLYKKLGRFYKKSSCNDVLPMFFVNLYIEKNPSNRLKKYQCMINNNINDSNDSYILDIEKNLAKDYKNGVNIVELNKKIKKLSKKYK